MRSHLGFADPRWTYVVQTTNEDVPIPNFITMIGNHDVANGDDAETVNIRELALTYPLIPFCVAHHGLGQEVPVQPMLDAITANDDTTAVKLALRTEEFMLGWLVDVV